MCQWGDRNAIALHSYTRAPKGVIKGLRGVPDRPRSARLHLSAEIHSATIDPMALPLNILQPPSLNPGRRPVLLEPGVLLTVRLYFCIVSGIRFTAVYRPVRSPVGVTYQLQ